MLERIKFFIVFLSKKNKYFNIDFGKPSYYDRKSGYYVNSISNVKYGFYVKIRTNKGFHISFDKSVVNYEPTGRDYFVVYMKIY